ncbi:hypothetical protein M513_05080 [Trichuris suis]|uniref:Uncharacterized protein n=1 Tax=Trichuris suis TaxID=68888 RepID=A0A085MA15_9BILA|nr:hypothetical protein M513_05080 [Trichuris suis]
MRSTLEIFNSLPLRYDSVTWYELLQYYCSGEEDNCGNSKRELHGADVSYQCLEAIHRLILHQQQWLLELNI